jgi:hypothetical protein
LISCLPAIAQEAERKYLLSFPVGYGDHLNSELCKKAAEIGGAACELVPLTVPLGQQTSAITILNAIGDNSDYFTQFKSDFVPWPWSDQAFDPMNPYSTPVISNPCSASYCRGGSICVWNQERPWVEASCKPVDGKIINDPTFPWLTLPLGYLSPLTKVNAEAMAGKSGHDTDTQTPPFDADLCGELAPGKICMGNYIKDEDGTLWQIP